MNSALKHTIIAMATVALSMTAACKSDDGPEAAEATAGAEAATADADAAAAEAEDAAGDAEEAAGDAEAAAEGSCGEGSCGAK